LKGCLFDVAAGALLHDIGKLTYRADRIDSRVHTESGFYLLKGYVDKKPILDSIRYHHKKYLIDAELEKDSPAYIVYVANNIAAGIDKIDIEGEENAIFDKGIPLSPVFNLLNGNSGSAVYKNIYPKDDKRIPETTIESNYTISETEYNRLLQDYKEGLSGIEFTPDYIDSILELNESYLSYVPSSIARDQASDISLHDHQRITAAIASSIYVYLTENNRLDFPYELLDREQDFYEEPAFLMLGCDFSGIQNFIYTISSKAALKGLRARSFYLDIMMEHIIDGLLSLIGLSRANVIYTGGGHAYVLLPNTDSAKDAVNLLDKKVNEWLIDHFGITLYLAIGTKECSGKDLMNIPYDKEPYSKIFRELSFEISKKKLHRYNYDQLSKLNTKDKGDNTGRECRVCGSTDYLVENHGDNSGVCRFCNWLEKISSAVIKDNIIFLVTDKVVENSASILLPNITSEEAYLNILKKEEARRYLEENEAHCIRVYGKNEGLIGFNIATKLWFGDYFKKSEDGSVASFPELAEASKGIKRLGVLRADVDDLGAAFISGFTRTNDNYASLSRYAVLSRSLSIFFKYYINSIVSREKVDEDNQFHLGKEAPEDGQRAATIVYSGGDDLFIVGAWDQIVELGVELNNEFKKYSQGTMTLSAGISFFDSTYPISRMAEEAGELEEQAKKFDGKNALSLFGRELDVNKSSGQAFAYLHTYSWETFVEKVINEKYRRLKAFFGDEKNSGMGGFSLLYRLLDYIKGSDMDRINIARCAYTLGRMAPPANARAEVKRKYSEISSLIYKWILSSEDRRQLITAMNLYAYYHREQRSE